MASRVSMQTVTRNRPAHRGQRAGPGSQSERHHGQCPHHRAVGDSRSQLYELRLAVEGESWPVGQDVRVAIPSAAGRDRAAVYRVDANGLAGGVATTPGIAQDELIKVDGIAPGDRGVICGSERLHRGQPVKVVNAEPSG